MLNTILQEIFMDTNFCRLAMSKDFSKINFVVHRSLNNTHSWYVPNHTLITSLESSVMMASEFCAEVMVHGYRIY